MSDLRLNLLLNIRQAVASISDVRGALERFAQRAESAEQARSSGKGWLRFFDELDDKIAVAGSTVGSLGDILGDTVGQAGTLLSGLADIPMLLARGNVAAVALTAAVALGAKAFEALEKRKEAERTVYQLGQAAQETGRKVAELGKLKVDVLRASVEQTTEALKGMRRELQDAQLSQFFAQRGLDTGTQERVGAQVKTAQELEQLRKDNADILARGEELDAERQRLLRKISEARRTAQTMSLIRAEDALRDFETKNAEALAAYRGVQIQLERAQQVGEAQLSAISAQQARALAQAQRGLDISQKALRETTDAQLEMLKLDERYSSGGPFAAFLRQREQADLEHAQRLSALRQQLAEAQQAVQSEGEIAQTRVDLVQAQIDAENRLHEAQRQRLATQYEQNRATAAAAKLAQEDAQRKAKQIELEKAWAQIQQDNAQAQSQAEESARKRQLAYFEQHKKDREEQRKADREAAQKQAEDAARAREQILRDAYARLEQSVQATQQLYTSMLQGTVSTLVTSLDTFLQDLIEGNEDAVAKMAKAVLKGIGSQLVGLGLQALFQGALELTDPLTAAQGAAKLTIGTAAIAAGVGLGAAGAAVPTSSGSGRAPSTPREPLAGRAQSPDKTVIHINFGPLGPEPDRAAQHLSNLLARGQARGLRGRA